MSGPVQLTEIPEEWGEALREHLSRCGVSGSDGLTMFRLSVDDRGRDFFRSQFSDFCEDKSDDDLDDMIRAVNVSWRVRRW